MDVFGLFSFTLQLTLEQWGAWGTNAVENPCVTPIPQNSDSPKNCQQPTVDQRSLTGNINS